MLQPEQEALIRRWREADLLRDRTIAEEKQLREQVLPLITSNGAPGTHRLNLDADWDLKAAIPETLKVEQDVEKIKEVCEALRKIGLPKEIIARLFKWECKVSSGEYNKLTTEQRAIADRIITAKPGSPQLDIVKAACR